MASSLAWLLASYGGGSAQPNRRWRWSTTGSVKVTGCWHGRALPKLAAWIKVWDALRPQLSSRRETLEDAGERIFPHMSQCLGNWGHDFAMEALNGSLRDASCGEMGLRFLRELLEVVPEGDAETLSYAGDLTMLLFNLRRDAEAERWAERLMDEFPDRAIGYISLADGLLHESYPGSPNAANIRRAISLLERALDRPVQGATAYDVPARLEGAQQSLAKAGLR